VSEIALTGGRSVAKFDPKKTKERLSLADAGLRHSKNIHDWEMMDEAVEFIINEHRMFVQWWSETVAKPSDFGRGKLSADRGEVISDSKAFELTRISHQQVSRWRNSLKDEVKYREVIRKPSHNKQLAGNLTNRGMETSHCDEWFTPERYILLARDVLGEIDLDPASHPIAQKAVAAKRFFTIADDGLRQEWHGRVWLNPPYSHPAIGNFVEKLVSEVAGNRVSAAILLTNNYTDTSWFHKAATAAQAICFTRGRIKFASLDGRGLESPTQGQAFYYFGGSVKLFADAFSEVGIVLSRMGDAA